MDSLKAYGMCEEVSKPEAHDDKMVELCMILTENGGMVKAQIVAKSHTLDQRDGVLAGAPTTISFRICVVVACARASGVGLADASAAFLCASLRSAMHMDQPRRF